MLETGVDSLVWKEIAEFAKKYNIQKVILFGSRSRGDYHKTSDIDLAVYPEVRLLRFSAMSMKKLLHY